MTGRWLSVVLMFLPLALYAEAPSKTAFPRAGETIEVSIVNLDVVVTDKHGQRVHGLTKDDFEVFEDGKPQPVTNFAAYVPESKAMVTSSKAGVSGPDAEAPKRQHRTIALFIERFRLPGFRVQPIFASLKQTLHDVVSPGDAVLIATWNVRTSIRLDYTDDLAAIDRTLDQIAKESVGASFDTLTAHREEVESMKDWFDEAATAAAAAGIVGGVDQAKWAIDIAAADLAEQERSLMIAKAAAVNSFISTMSNDDGRKALLLMTRRFSRYAGAEYLYANNPGSPLDPEKAGRFSTYNLMDTLKATANAHGVTIYALYPPGLEYTSFSGPSTRNLPQVGNGVFDNQVLDNELAALGDLTKATGGTMAWGSVDIVKQLPRVRDDFDDYYSLAYRVAARNDDRSRSVVVKAKNPDYLVRSRRQYMEKSDDNRVRDQVIASLFRPPNPSGMTLSTTLGKPVPVDKHRVTLPVSVRIPVSSLMTTQDGAASKGAFSVYIATGRVVGETSDVTKQTIPFTVSDVQKAKDGYFTYDFSLLTDFSTNRLSVGVYDEVSHDTGYARLDLYALKN
jgi:VWFA-related protein